jgi:hypothetical protein
MERSENKTKKKQIEAKWKQKTAILFAAKRNGSEKLPSCSLRSEMEANFFRSMQKNEMKQKQNEKEAKTSKRKRIE